MMSAAPDTISLAVMPDPPLLTDPAPTTEQSVALIVAPPCVSTALPDEARPRMQGVADALPARRAIALTFTGMVAAAPNMRLRLSGSGVVSSTRTALAPASGVSAVDRRIGDAMGGDQVDRGGPQYRLRSVRLVGDGCSQRRHVRHALGRDPSLIAAIEIDSQTRHADDADQRQGSNNADTTVMAQK
jgi:hypothetical protein